MHHSGTALGWVLPGSSCDERLELWSRSKLTWSFWCLGASLQEW